LLERSKPIELRLFLTNAIFSIPLYDQVLGQEITYQKIKKKQKKKNDQENELKNYQYEMRVIVIPDPHYKTYTACVNVNVCNENGIHF